MNDDFKEKIYNFYEQIKKSNNLSSEEEIILESYIEELSKKIKPSYNFIEKIKKKEIDSKTLVKVVDALKEKNYDD